MQYITVQGDMFDRIAKEIYESETLANIIIEANPSHMGTVVFSAGVMLEVPELEEKPLEYNRIPPWRRES